MQCSSYEHQMESQKRQACTTVERRKKLAIFATLCAAAVLVIILVVVLLTMLKSENDKQEEYTFGMYSVFVRAIDNTMQEHSRNTQWRRNWGSQGARAPPPNFFEGPKVPFLSKLMLL